MSRFSYLLSCFLLVFSPALFAQTTDLGLPKSWWSKQDLGNAPSVLLPSFDVDRCLREDALNEAQKIGPYRFGYEHRVQHNLQNVGQWTTLHNGDRIWRVAYHSPSAYSLNFIFDQFYLPQGASIYLYRMDKTDYLGAYTHRNNNPDQMLGTELVSGDHVVIEYYEPAAVAGQGRLQIGMVVHAYKDVSRYAQGIIKALNDAGKCNHDVNCPLGNGWQNEINSVALMIANGSGFCTGALVNNTRNDGTPYFLTANHCFSGSPANWVFRFNWDSPTPRCGQNANSVDPGPPYNSVNGAVLRARNAGSDFCLLELNSRPTGNVYYAGWDRSGTAPNMGMGIHHPSGDIKKICLDSNALTAATWSNAQCWRVANWDLGVTEPGSSGSPLFDRNKRVVGQLYGGSAACNTSGTITNDNNQPDFYGRFSVSWTGGGTNSTRLSNWLDPANTGATVVDGYNPNAPTVANDGGVTRINNLSGTYCNTSTFVPEITLRNFGSAALTSATIEYSVNGGAPSTYSWSGNLASGATTNVTLPTITVTTGGNTTFTAAVATVNGSADPNAVNNASATTFQVILNGQQANYTLQPDCYGSELSWVIRDANNTVLYSGGPYTDASAPAALISNLCLGVGCYTYVLTDSYGDGLFGGTNCTVNGRNFGDYFILGPAGDTLVRMTATNGNFGRTATHNFCITAPVAPTAVVSVNNANICQGGNVSFGNQSTGASTYSWSFPGGSPSTSTDATPTVNYATAGTYTATLVATNNIGSSTATVTITVNANNISITGNVSNATNGQNNGEISLSTSGVSSPRYLWSNGSTTANISGLAPGNYTVTVTDAAGCAASQGFSINNVAVGVETLTAINYLNLFPNPSQGQLTIEYRLSQSQDLRLELYTATGQLLQSQNLGIQQEGQANLDLSNYSSGFYFVKIIAGQEMIARKVVKQ